jgi:fructokinase
MVRSKVVVWGEVLVDFYAGGDGDLSSCTSLTPHLGGAPANVAVQLARLGIDVALHSAVGDDPLAARIARVLKDERVTAHLRCIYGRRTGITFIERVADDRRFFGFRDNCADEQLDARDVPPIGADVAVVHTGTVTLRSTTASEATVLFQQAGRRAGAIVSLDVNLRPRMFANVDAMIEAAREAAGRCDVIKGTAEEFAMMTTRDIDDIDGQIADAFSWGARMVCVTRDKHGAILANRKHRVDVESPETLVVDATGAGDAFTGTLLRELVVGGVSTSTLDDVTADALGGIGRAACLAGAAATTGIGATSAMLLAGFE